MAAKRNIKGITIEINGDVTNLDKALSWVDKSLKTTQTNLKDVEKLLKLDPKNVELLDQKQRLLSQQVEQTADRYELLKKTMEESTASNPRYEKWEKAQASLQGQITKTEKALSALEKEQKKLQALGFDADTTQMAELQEQIDATREKSAKLHEQMAATYEKLGRPISVDQYDALQRELVETKKDMEDAAKAAEDFSPELATAAANAQELAGKMEGVSSKAKSVSSTMAPVTAGIVAAGAAMIANVAATDEYRAKMSMLEANAQSLGVSMGTVEEAYARFYAVSGDAEASIEAVSNLLNAGLDDNSLLRAVEDISGAVISFPDTLKIESLSDSLQETLATGEATGQYAELLERLGVNLDTVNANMQQATTLEGKQTIALQELAQKGLGDLYRGWEQNNQGLIENRNATREFQDAMANLAQVSLPVVTTLTEMVSGLVNWFANLPDGVQKPIVVIAALVALISPIAGIISAITGAIGAFSAVTKVASAVGTLFSVLMSSWALKIALVVAALVGLIALLKWLFGNKDEIEHIDVDSLTSGRGGSSGGAGSSGGRGIRGFASGGVFEPNSPILGVLGDNTHEREVAAPESMLSELLDEALLRAGGTQPTGDQRASMVLDGRTFARLIFPYLQGEARRMGTTITT